MILQATEQELAALVDLALLLWPGHTREELMQELSPLLRRADAACFLLIEQGRPCAFAQCQLRRDYVEGAESSPVGYLEGIFVKEACRRQGYARALLQACEEWARSQGCTEFASDCELDNEASRRFHLGVGFAEAGRILCFCKKL